MILAPGKRLIVKPLVEEVSKGGLLLVKGKDENVLPKRGVIGSIGPDVHNETEGKYEVGGVVWYNGWVMAHIEDDKGQKFASLDISDVLAVVK